MVLPGTGNAISFNDIRIELGIPNSTFINLQDANGGILAPIQKCQGPWPDSGSVQGTNPDSLSEWWAYDHSKTGSLFMQGNNAISCFAACNGTPNCDYSIYQFGSVYYTTAQCNSTANFASVSPTLCTGGTNEGQTCYQFTNGTITQQTTCVSCIPQGGSCVGNENNCCEGGCCNGQCAPSAC